MTVDSPAGQSGSPTPQTPRGPIVLWMIAAGLVILLVPLALAASTIRNDAQRVSADLVSIRQSLTSIPTPLPEVQELTSSLAQLQAQAAQIDVILATLTATRTNWLAIMTALGNYNPDQIVLSSLAQAGSQITIGGKAVDDASVVDYVHVLEASGQFSSVILQSVRTLATLPATITPTSTPTPTPTFTPTTNPRDEFEPDDTQPKPIFLGQPQTHNFYPSGDVDAVTFLAKAGRTYRAATINLAPGVDTVLTVTAGTATFTNDDVAPGTLRSEIVFQAPGSADITVVARVANRGPFSPDARYQIAVDEIVPTPASSSPTPTGTPTASPTPSFTASPTSEPRDGFEPDDIDPKPIAIGETQLHNFFPDGDVDKVSFVAKLGRVYQAFTSELALGVDTAIHVSQGGKQWINDDAASGTGSYESMVCFQAPADGTAVVTITNVQRQFGTAKTYKITVKEIADLTEPKCAQTTPVASLFRAPGLAAPEAMPRRAGPNRQALLATLNVEFVIVVEIKVIAP